jgi:predicted  nucleic acid-binding Zn-ribbon protein
MSVKQVQDHIARLEAHIVQLETENKWLRDLATEKMEKMEKMGNAVAGSKEGVEGGDDWKHSGSKDGVGT